MSTENVKGVLLLSHVGFSFMEDLATAVTARGLRVCVLSSLPEPQYQQTRPGPWPVLGSAFAVKAPA